MTSMGVLMSHAESCKVRLYRGKDTKKRLNGELHKKGSDDFNHFDLAEFARNSARIRGGM